MDKAGLQKVLTVSHELASNPASNLITGGGLWLVKPHNPNENIIVDFALERLQSIPAIEIQNHGTAFIEILVGRSSWQAKEEYQVLLPKTHLLTPKESQSDKARQQVTHKFYASTTADLMVPLVAKQEWDRLRLVCSQPYSNQPFGLSSLKLLSAPSIASTFFGVKTQPTMDLSPSKDVSNVSPSKDVVGRIGSFALRAPPTFDKSEVRPGHLFSSTKQTSNTEEWQRTQYELKAQSKSLLEQQLAKEDTSLVQRTQHNNTSSASRTLPFSISSPRLSSPPSFPSIASFEEPSEIRRDPFGKHVQIGHAEIFDDEEEDDKTGWTEAKSAFTTAKKVPLKPALNKASSAVEKMTNSNQERIQEFKRKTEELRHKTEQVTPSSSSPSSSSSAPTLAFNSLMKDVRFVISGIQNPERSELRDRGLAMGAVYEQDITPRTTHLICPFAATPKHQQMIKQHPKGYVVKADWIHQSFKLKKRVAESDFALEVKKSPAPSPSVSRNGSAASPPKRRKDDDDDNGEIGDYDLNDSFINDKDEEPTITPPLSDEDDLNGSSFKKRRLSNAESHEPSKTSASTFARRLALPKLFDNVRVFFYKPDSADKLRRLSRVLMMYNGQIDDYMSESTTHVVSDEPWDANCARAVRDNPSLKFVRSAWLVQSHQRLKRLNESKFLMPK